MRFCPWWLVGAERLFHILHESLFRVMNSQFLHAALAAQQDQSASPDMSSYILMIAMIAMAFWLIVMRPQKRERARRQQLLDNVKKGDKIVTIGGIHGWVAEVEKGGRSLTIRVDTKTTMKIDRTAVARVEGAEDESAAEKKGE